MAKFVTRFFPKEEDEVCYWLEPAGTQPERLRQFRTGYFLVGGVRLAGVVESGGSFHCYFCVTRKEYYAILKAAKRRGERLTWYLAFPRQTEHSLRKVRVLPGPVYFNPKEEA